MHEFGSEAEMTGAAWFRGYRLLLKWNGQVRDWLRIREEKESRAHALELLRGSGTGWTRWAVRLSDGDGRRVPRSGDEFPGGADGDGTSRGGLGERAGDAFMRVRWLQWCGSASGEAMACRRSAAAWHAIPDELTTQQNAPRCRGFQRRKSSEI